MLWLWICCVCVGMACQCPIFPRIHTLLTRSRTTDARRSPCGWPRPSLRTWLRAPLPIGRDRPFNPTLQSWHATLPLTKTTEEVGGVEVTWHPLVTINPVRSLWMIRSTSLISCHKILTIIQGETIIYMSTRSFKYVKILLQVLEQAWGILQRIDKTLCWCQRDFRTTVSPL